MTTALVTVGIGIGLLFAGVLGGYAIAEQTYNPNNMMMNDPQGGSLWMETMMGTMMNDPSMRQHMMDQMMENPEFMQDMENKMMDTSSNDTGINSKSVHMGMNLFMPNELHIEPNTKVTWITHDMETHNVSGIFKTDSGNEITILSGDIPHMEKWSYTFEESGVFEFTCGYHENEGMKGAIVVSTV